MRHRFNKRQHWHVLCSWIIVSLVGSRGMQMMTSTRQERGCNWGRPLVSPGSPVWGQARKPQHGPISVGCTFLHWFNFYSVQSTFSVSWCCTFEWYCGTPRGHSKTALSCTDFLISASGVEHFLRRFDVFFSISVFFFSNKKQLLCDQKKVLQLFFIDLA